MGSIRKLSQTSALFFDFRYKGQRCREYTALPDTGANRKKLQKVLDKIEEQIARNSFNYQEFFPGSKNALKFEPSAASVPAQPVPLGSVVDMVPTKTSPLFKDFVETWFSEKCIEWRASHKKTVRGDLDGRLIPEFGEKMVGEITKADILAFRADLAKAQARNTKKPLSNPRINKIMNPLRQIL